MTRRTPCWLLTISTVALLAACGGTVGGGPRDDAGVGPDVTPISYDEEICDDGYDNDGDGQIDEDCPCAAGQQQACYPGTPGEEGVGACQAGVMTCEGSGEFRRWGPCVGAVLPSPEICGNDVDEDCDGTVLPCGGGVDSEPVELADGGVADHSGTITTPDAEITPPDSGPPPECSPNQTQPCYGGPPGTDGVGQCHGGTQTCQPDGTWGPCQGEQGPGLEQCENGVDEDCDGQDAECPPISIPLFFFGDCVTASCPASHPYPVGCSVIFSPSNDNRGCVAHQPGSSSVFFKAGNECNKGFVTGSLKCDDKPGPPLGPLNCPIIGKLLWLYPQHSSQCPQ